MPLPRSPRWRYTHGGELEARAVAEERKRIMDKHGPKAAAEWYSGRCQHCGGSVIQGHDADDGKCLFGPRYYKAPEFP